MAADWTPFLRRVKRHREQGGTDYDVLWDEFCSIARTSSRRDELMFVVRAGDAAPVTARAILAIAVARILEPIEWPTHWEGPRQNLSRALRNVIRELSAQHTGTAGNLLGATPVDLAPARRVLLSVDGLLVKPCRRDEIMLVGAAMNGGLSMAVRTFRRAAIENEEQQENPHLGAARIALSDSLLRLRRFADEMNDAIGETAFVVPLVRL